ncbi:YbaN family protein [Spirochaetota bacterium]
MNNEMSRIKKVLLITSAAILVALGFIGIFVPLLPTTPFLLLAAYCTIKSSKRFHNWIITNRLFGSYINNYRNGKEMTVTAKVITNLLLWLSMSYSIIFVAENTILRVVLFLIAAGVSVHIIRLKTYKEKIALPDKAELLQDCEK